MINPYTKIKEGYFRKSQVTTQPKEKEVKLLPYVIKICGYVLVLFMRVQQGHGKSPGTLLV
jgi:hypothetical protein